jgi:hypothetical protein
MDRQQARGAAGWLAQRERPEEGVSTRYPWLPFGALPAGVAARVPSSALSDMEARQAQRRRVYAQPRDWRGRWVALAGGKDRA